MWEKIKKSKFALKFKEGWGRGGAVIVVFCLVLALAVILSVSVATNRAKKKYGGENTDGLEEITEAPAVDDGGNNGGNDTGDKPSEKEEGSKPTGSGIEEFKLEAPVSGVISKGHDASIQVWSNTMEDYRVHLGVDVVAEVDTPVFAAADGVVSKVWDDPLMGRCVAISHGDEVYTYYKNLNVVLADGITQGAQVKCGDTIGKVGETAMLEIADEPHLHLEMTVGGLSVDPRDYFSASAQEAMSRDTSYEQSANESQKTGK